MYVIEHEAGTAPLLPQLSQARRRGVLAICCMSILIVGLDSTAVNVALPSIGRDLHSSVSGLQWIVDAYLLVLASTLLLSGSTADRFGRRRIFQTGLLLFTTGSLLCSLAPNLALLIVFRMVQAIGGSMLNPVAVSIIAHTFTNLRERAQAIGVWGAVYGLSLALGPIVGGALASSVGWRAIFWINIPIGLAAMALTALYVPESRAPRARRIDPLGQLLISVVLAALTFGIIEGPESGWGSMKIILSLALSFACFTAFLAYEPRRTEPLIELRFFRSTPFSGATVIAICVSASLSGYLFVNTLYLQDVRGLSALHAGIDTLPLAVMVMVGAPISGRIVGSRGPRRPLVLAAITMTTSCLILTRLSSHTPFSWLFFSYVLFGIGFGVVNAPITNTAVAGMPIAQVGVAAGVASTSRQIGQTLGVAVIGVLATASTHGSIRSELALASHAGWWTLAGCGLLTLGLGFVTTTPSARRSAQRAAAQFVANGCAR